MSTSNTSSSAPSGPSKFRKDAAIFSPGGYQQPPPMVNYPPDYPYMYAYNGYMMYQPQYEYNPYMPVQYMPPGQYPYMPNGMYMNNYPAPNMGRSRPATKKTHKKPYGSDGHDEATASPSTENTEPEVEPEPQPEPTPEEDSATEAPSDSSSEVLKEPRFPLFINSDWDDYRLDESLPISRKQLFLNKSAVVARYAERSTKDFLIEKTAFTLVDYNSNTTTNVNDSNDVPTTNNDIIEKDAKLQSNWASVLKSSAPPPTHKRTKSRPVNGTVAPVVVAPVVAEPAESESQPLGILSLKSMFDPKLSLDSDLPHFQIAPRGLTNTGNICYMNSILQVLLYCEPFNKLFKFIESNAIGSLDQDSKTPLIDAVIQFFEDFSPSTQKKSLSPEKFYMKLIANEKFSHLKWGQQEDAEEFLTYLLDGLHEEFVDVIKSLNASQIDALINKYEAPEFKLSVKSAIKIIKKHHDSNETEEHEEENNGWSEVGSSKQVSAKRTVEIEPSPIKTIFGGQFRSVLQVPKHKESQSITLDPFQCIQLDISDEKITTIEEAFIHLNEPESIPFKSTQNKEVIAKKQTFIDQLPNILVIQLKRFSYQNENEKASAGIEKLKKKMQYNHNLVIPNECISSLSKKQPNFKKEYQLIGVVYHHGFGAEGGHYTADVLRKASLADLAVQQDWIRIDDTQITKIKEQDVLQESNDNDSKSAYILIYQKI